MAHGVIHDDELPETSSSIVTEEKSEFLGLPGGMIFVPFMTMVFLMKFSNFIVGLIGAAIMWGVLALWLRGKPAHFLVYWVWSKFSPCIYRPRLDQKDHRTVGLSQDNSR